MMMLWYNVAWENNGGKKDSTIVPAYSKEDAEARFRRVEKDINSIVGVNLLTGPSHKNVRHA